MGPDLVVLYIFLLMIRFFSVISLLTSVKFGLKDTDRSSTKRIGAIFGASFSVAFASTMAALSVVHMKIYPVMFISAVVSIAIFAVLRFEAEPRLHSKNQSE